MYDTRQDPVWVAWHGPHLVKAASYHEGSLAHFLERLQRGRILSGTTSQVVIGACVRNESSHRREASPLQPGSYRGKRQSYASDKPVPSQFAGCIVLPRPLHWRKPLRMHCACSTPLDELDTTTQGQESEASKTKQKQWLNVRGSTKCM
jgi:hypothetical protein